MAQREVFRRHICDEVRQVLLGKKKMPLDFYQSPGEPWVLRDGEIEHVIRYCPYCGQDLNAEIDLTPDPSPGKEGEGSGGTEEQLPQALLDLARLGQVPGRERRKT